MAFAANRGGPWNLSPAGAWTVKPSSNRATGEPSTGSDGTSTGPHCGDNVDEVDSSRSAAESCRSLVVPCVSLVTAPLSSKDRQTDVDSQLRPPDQPPRRPIPSIVEVQADADTSSTDDEHQLTMTTTSNVDLSPPIVDVATVIEFQKIPEGPTLQPLSPSTTEIQIPPEIMVGKDETVVQIDEPLRTVSDGSRRSSDQSTDADILEVRRPSIGQTVVECSDDENVSVDDLLPMPLSDRETNSGEQVRDDVIVVVDNDDVNDDVDSDVVGTFFTPSIVDSYVEAFSPPCESDRITELVDDSDSPDKQVPGNSAVVADGAYKPLESSATSAPLLKNGADSAAVGWPPTNRFGLAANTRAENSASTAATSAWRKNPLARLVRHRKDMVCQTQQFLRLFDLETGVQVASKVGNLHSKFRHDRPLGSRIIRYVRDGRTNRQKDGQKQCLLPPFIRSGA